ncbi:MAG: Uncharacterised protein [Opitutia bacterium UBA7350]|nr:MAG: Uncharacterised protein [Opitutae bacterium UBA7350]
MQLTEEQLEAVKDWVRAGESLATIQNRLRETMNVAMTYMEVRFLLDDLDVVSEVVETPEVEEGLEEAAELEVAEAAVTDSAPIDAMPVNSEDAKGGVRVEVDAIKRPGALLSGTVIFSDGKSMSWQLDASGQLGLLPSDDPDYRPSPEDVEAFQSELSKAVQSQGY